MYFWKKGLEDGVKLLLEIVIIVYFNYLVASNFMLTSVEIFQDIFYI